MQFIDPEIFLIYRGFVVYHVYRHDIAEDRREFWYGLTSTCSEDQDDVFDVRVLPYEGKDHESKIKQAIDDGHFDNWERDEPPDDVDDSVNGQVIFTQCQNCAFFVEQAGDDYGHLCDEAEIDPDEVCDAKPANTAPLWWWQLHHPELFKKHEDGLIGPNSIYYEGPKPLPGQGQVEKQLEDIRERLRWKTFDEAMPQDHGVISGEVTLGSIPCLADFNESGAMVCIPNISHAKGRQSALKTFTFKRVRYDDPSMIGWRERVDTKNEIKVD
jgi:hypothetical protein